MEPTTNKKQMKINLCAYRRLDLQHKTDERFREQRHRSELQSHRHREQIFQRKLERLRKNVERVDVDDDEEEEEEEEEETFLRTNCLSRIQNHYRLLNFSAQTEQRLLNPFSTSPKSSKDELSDSLPNVNRKKSTNGIEPIAIPRRVSSSQTRNDLEEKSFQSFIDQRMFDERRKQRHQNERKSFLLKDFDELKHSIDDPHATLSVLAALSRALLFLESESE